MEYSWLYYKFHIGLKVLKIIFANNIRIFQEPNIPMRPLPGAISQIRYKFMDTNYCNQLKQEFEKRPIWSKNALKVRLQYNSDTLKVSFLSFN